MKRTVYRIRFCRDIREWEIWVVWPECGSGWLCARPTQAEAVAEATRLARRNLADGCIIQVVLHGKNGRIRWERTYGRDPRRTRG